MQKVIIKDRTTQSYIGIVEVYPDEIRLLETEFSVISIQEVHMKNFAEMNSRFLKLRKWFPVKLAYRLTVYGMQEVEKCFMQQR